MTSIEFTRNSSGAITGFTMDGHAGFDSERDVVCAALSAVSYCTLNGIEKVLGVQFGYEMEDGYLSFVLPRDLDQVLSEKVAVLLDTMYLFMVDLQKQHQDCVCVREQQKS